MLGICIAVVLTTLLVVFLFVALQPYPENNQDKDGNTTQGTYTASGFIAPGGSLQKRPPRH